MLGRRRLTPTTRKIAFATGTTHKNITAETISGRRNAISTATMQQLTAIQALKRMSCAVQPGPFSSASKMIYGGYLLA